MTNFMPIETPGGVIWAEIDENQDSTEITLAGAKKQKPLKGFEETANALKENAQYLLKILEEGLGPDEVEISCGIKVGAEAGTPLFGLAKASGEASYTIKIKWTAGKSSNN